MDVWVNILSLVLNLLLGGGFLITLLTLKSVRKKASIEAEAAQSNVETTNLQNFEKVVEIWKKLVEDLQNELQSSRNDYNELFEQVGKLRKEVNRLNSNVTRVIKLLDKITPENINEMVEEIKAQINKA